MSPESMAGYAHGRSKSPRRCWETPVLIMAGTVVSKVAAASLSAAQRRMVLPRGGTRWLQRHRADRLSTGLLLAGRGRLGPKSGCGSTPERDPAPEARDVEERSRAARAAANDLTARAVLEAAVPLTDTRAAPAVAYLLGRALEPPYPENLKYLPDVWLAELHRVGESALVAELDANGASLGVQVTWLTPLGTKSLHAPVRQTFLFADPRAKAAVFSLRVPENEVWHAKDAPEHVVCEGAEDALSCSRPRWRDDPRRVGCRAVETRSRCAAAKRLPCFGTATPLARRRPAWMCCCCTAPTCA